MPHLLRAVVFGAGALATQACSDHQLMGPVPAVQLQLAPDSIVIDAIDSVLPMVLTAHDAAGEVIHPRLLQWTSSNPQAAVIDGSGAVTTLQDGKTEVEVSVGPRSTAKAVVQVHATIWNCAELVSMKNHNLHPDSTHDSVSVVVYARMPKRGPQEPR